MIRVLLVDDSEVSLMVLERILEKEPDISIIGKAKNGHDAITLASRLAPDIITMDINMPGMDGFAATRQIMEQTPVPIIIVSGIDNIEEVRASFKAVEAGALAVFRKPPDIGDPDYENAVAELVFAIRAYAEVRVVRRRPNIPASRGIDSPVLSIPVQIMQDIRLVVIGASTGGPQVVQEILRNIEPSFPIPMILVQHMSPGFIDGFAIWLSDSTGFPVQMAQEGETVQPEILYIAPDGRHTGITSDLRIQFSYSPPEHNLRPSVSYLFRSAAMHLGSSVLGILLSGMGCDGAEELLLIKQKGGCTIIQDKDSSFVYGMPRAAGELNAGNFSLPPVEIARFLLSISERRSM